MLLCSAILTVGCFPTKPPVYVRTSSEEAKRLQVQSSKFEVLPPSKVVLNDFKRAFEKKYGSQEAFVDEFRKSLQSKLGEGASPEATSFRLEIPSVLVTNDVVTTTMMTGGGGPMGPPPMPITQVKEYCVIRMEYKVIAGEGSPLLEGLVIERTDKGEFLHPNQSKLVNAVDGVQRHLVDYLRGRMAVEHVAPPVPPAEPKTK